MDPTSASFAGGWLALATGPQGAAFVAGIVIGGAIGIYLWQKFVVKPRIEDHMASCERQLVALRKDIDELITFRDKWTRLVEKAAAKEIGDLL